MAWTVKKLGEVADIIGGYAFKSSNLNDYQITKEYLPVVKIGNLINDGSLNLNKVQYHNFNKDLSGFLIKQKDILIAMTGATTGKVAISNVDQLLLNQRVGLIRPRNNIIFQGYLKFLLLSDLFYKYCQITAGGGAQGNISPSQIMNYLLPVPTLSAQKKIVERLDAIRKAQELCDQQIQKTEELFESLLQTQLLASENKFPKKNIRELAQNFDSKRKPITRSDRVSGIYPYYGASGIVDYVDGYIFNEDLLLISEDGANLIARVTPIAFSISGKAWVNNHAHVLKFKNIYLQKIVEHYLKKLDLKAYITGTAQPKLNQESLNKIEIPYPDFGKQKIIVEKLETVQNYKKLLQKQKSLLKELFDSVLDKSMKGELDNES